MDGEHWRALCPYDRIQLGSLVVLSETETAIPLKAGEQVLGALAIRRRRSDPLTPDDASRLQLIAETYANVLARRHAEEEMLRAELHARRSLAKLAFVSRQRSMGELTASLAHELNQPLTGILGNAQAARRMLAVTPPDLDEFKQILDDIVDDIRRASETILRIKKWLQKGDLETVLLDVNKVILEVATLLKSDAVIRNLRVDLRLSECPLMVRGDAAELRQLILNLLLNAMDAVSDLDPADRVVSVVSERSGDLVHVAVQDFGVGVPKDAADHLFEPFFTTKAHGMGMGLSISKSIVESHRGSIWLSDTTDRGARFEFVLPEDTEGQEA